ncbi:hypothetical protein [Saccharicrinis sp. FJH54]|uniref:hypothetical protein n=1 Tax=Saccharicrinis sp. FJH54 TaxID=3344665 RepID=UPI0035D438A2
MKKILLIAYCFLIISCSNTKKDDLKSNVTIREAFNDQEIKDLTMMMNFFEDQVVSLSNNKYPNREEYLKKYLTQLANNAENEGLFLNISFKKQKEMYSQISDSTFNQIWTIGKYWEFQSPDTLKYLFYNSKGDYIRFMNLLSEDDNLIRNYYEAFISSKNMSPTMIANVLMRYEELDISDIRIRLFIAVHYLTINDHFERKEKY